jgi:hypothetical protein
LVDPIADARWIKVIPDPCVGPRPLDPESSALNSGLLGIRWMGEVAPSIEERVRDFGGILPVSCSSIYGEFDGVLELILEEIRFPWI